MAICSLSAPSRFDRKIGPWLPWSSASWRRGSAGSAVEHETPPAPADLTARRPGRLKPAYVIIGAVVLLIALMWVGVVISIGNTRTYAVEKAQANGRNLMLAFREQVAFVLGSLDSEMKLLAAQLARSDGSLDLYAWGRENVLVAPGVANATFIGHDGKSRSTTLSPDAKPTDLSDREHFRVFLGADAPDMFIGRSVVGRDSGKIILPIARRVSAADGSFLGVLVVLIDPGALTALHKSVDLGPAGVISLSGTDNLIRARYSLSSPNGTSGVGSSIAGPGRPDVITGDATGVVMASGAVDGVSRLYTYGRVGNYPLVVTVGLDLDREFAIARSHTRTICLVAFAATLLLGSLAIYLICECRAREERESELADERNKLHRVNLALLRSRDRAEAASRAKSLFLANMSHELRTPLNAIIGFSEIIRDQSFGPNAVARYRDYAADVFNSGQRLLTLINEILDTAKIEAGKMQLREDEVWFPEIVERSIHELRLQLEQKGIVVNLSYADSLPVIRGDGDRLTQVLINLLSNAVKFTPEDGRVTIGLACDADGALACDVGDSGIGMTEEEIAVALEPFSQVENSMTKTHEGTGLGLPLAKRLMELHGGSLQISSVAGAGTTVRLQLPASRAIASAGHTARASTLRPGAWHEPQPVELAA